MVFPISREQLGEVKTRKKRQGCRHFALLGPYGPLCLAQPVCVSMLPSPAHPVSSSVAPAATSRQSCVPAAPQLLSPAAPHAGDPAGRLEETTRAKGHRGADPPLVAGRLRRYSAASLWSVPRRAPPQRARSV